MMHSNLYFHLQQDLEVTEVRDELAELEAELTELRAELAEVTAELTREKEKTAQIQQQRDTLLQFVIRMNVSNFLDSYGKLNFHVFFLFLMIGKF